MNKPRRAPRRQVDGVLLLDKPSGMTSNAALHKARWLLNAAKGGHTGTLDPMATGLLPLCFGEATKFAGELLNADKSYRATLQLGITTTTADAEGEVIDTRPVSVTEQQFRAELANWLGDIDQVPPMYSALKRDGKPLYEYARAGIDVARESRRVHIYRLELLEFQEWTAIIDVDCSKGTYIRTLAADIGEALGCGAHLQALRRTRIGRLALNDAVTLADFESLPPDRRVSRLAATDALLSELRVFPLSASDLTRIQHGQSIRCQAAPGERYRLYRADGLFIGLAVTTEDGWLKPVRLLANRPDDSWIGTDQALTDEKH